MMPLMQVLLPQNARRPPVLSGAGSARFIEKLIWFSLDQTESQQLENTASYQPVLVFPHQIQDWLLFSQVISGITTFKSIALIAESAAIALKSVELSVIYTSMNITKAWLHRLNREKNQTTLLQGISHTQPPPEAPQPCPSSIPFSHLVL